MTDSATPTAPAYDVHSENALLATILLQGDPSQITATAAKGATQWRRHSGLAPRPALTEDTDGRTANGYLLNDALRKAAEQFLANEDHYAPYVVAKTPVRTAADPAAKIAETLEAYNALANVPMPEATKASILANLGAKLRSLGYEGPEAAPRRVAKEAAPAAE